MDPVTIGVDIGQQRDPTAIAVVEEVQPRSPIQSGWRPAGTVVEPKPTGSIYTVRFLERLALGTPYPEVARRVADVALGVTQQGKRVWPELLIDVTGVGRPVGELVQAAIEERGGRKHHVKFATFTYGRALTYADGEQRVGKSYLVSRLQVLLQTDRLALPKTAEAEALAKELLDYEIRVSDEGDDRYGAFKVGTHDDLVTALGLAVLRGPRQETHVYDRTGKRIA